MLSTLFHALLSKLTPSASASSFSSPDPPLPPLNPETYKAAHSTALETETSLLQCSISVHHTSPHRTDAIALLDQAFRILRSQHGGKHPHVFLEESWELYMRGKLSREECVGLAGVLARWEAWRVRMEFWLFADPEWRADRRLGGVGVDVLVRFLGAWVAEQEV